METVLALGRPPHALDRTPEARRRVQEVPRVPPPGGPR